MIEDVQINRCLPAPKLFPCLEPADDQFSVQGVMKNGSILFQKVLKFDG